jgi:hypothetical protein
VNDQKTTRVELGTIGLSIIGAIIATFTQQVAYLATPLTLSFLISSINRHKELIKANYRIANLEQQVSSASRLIAEESRSDRDLLVDSIPARGNFQNIQVDTLANQQQIDRLEKSVSNLEQRGRDDLLPFLTEIDLTKDSLKQLGLSFSNFQKEFHHSQDSTRVVATDPILTEVRKINQYKIEEVVEAVVSDLEFSNLVQQKVDQSSQLQFEIFRKLIPKQYILDPIVGRVESRQVFLDALRQSQERLILVCPWLRNYAIDRAVKDLIKAALIRGVSIDIGWGHLSDVNNNKSRLSKEELLRSSKPNQYNAVPWLYQLQDEYKGLLTLRVLGTHEKFLVCDRRFAMIGSHNFMTSGASSSEREVGIKTDSPETIDKLIELFDRVDLQ